MSLLVTGNRNYKAYFEDTGGVWIGQGGDRKVIRNGTASGQSLVYIDKFDRLAVFLQTNTTTFLVGRMDPQLIDNSSSSVGVFTSPISQTQGNPFFLGDYEPATTSQRMFQVIGPGGVFQELNINDPSLLVDADPFPNIDRLGPDLITPSTNGFWTQPSGTGHNFVFFPEIDQAISCSTRFFVGTTAKSNSVVDINTDTGFGQSAGIVGRYATGEHEFNRPAIFGETSIVFRGIQFLPDPESTHNQPLGEMFLWSSATADPLDSGRLRLYVQFVDWNPFNRTGTTPNRIHQRQTLLSRVTMELNSVPTGNPPTPLDGTPALNVAAMQNNDAFFTTFGSRRIQITHSDPIANANTVAVQASKAAVAAFISPPAPKSEPLTDRLISYQSEVTGDLGELSSNAAVTWSLVRLSTEAEVLATTPTPGETVTVANVPIDRTTHFPAGFDVFEDGVALVEGGGNDYTVNEALGQITFISPKPLSGGEVYTATYSHPATSATPSHGTLVDSVVFSDLNGFAIGQIVYPNDPTLEGHLDFLQATTPT